MIGIRRYAVSAARLAAPGLAVRGLQGVWQHTRQHQATAAFALQRRWLSDQGTGKAVDKIVDVEGGKIGEHVPEEGKLFMAERAKNLVAAHRRFQLSTYNRLPDGKDDMTSIHSDPSAPVNAWLYGDMCQLVMQLDPDNLSHKHHMENCTKVASAAVSVGHFDPPPLIPVFTRVGLIPPVVRIVGDMVLVPESEEASVRSELKEQGHTVEGGRLFFLETGSVSYVDLFNKVNPVSMRDFRAAYVDKLAHDQMQLIYLANTKFLDDLPTFVKNFLGIPVADAYLYSADRAGFSVFGLREGTDNHWREYRFPFAREVSGLKEFENMMLSMVEEVKAAEKAEAESSTSPAENAQ